MVKVPRAVGDEGTGETVPRHIYIHEVELAVSKAVPRIEPSFWKETHIRSMLNRWYNAGEPMWMAASGMASMADEYSLEKRQARFDKGSGAGALRGLRGAMLKHLPQVPPGTKKG
jgi:hypothetical protein